VLIRVRIYRHISAGETADPSALRELEEELGLAIEPASALEFTGRLPQTHMLPVTSTRASAVFDREYASLYLCRYNNNRTNYDGTEANESLLGKAPKVTDLTLQPSEVAAARWVPLAVLTRVYCADVTSKCDHNNNNINNTSESNTDAVDALLLGCPCGGSCGCLSSISGTDVKPPRVRPCAAERVGLVPLDAPARYLSAAFPGLTSAQKTVTTALQSA